MFVSNNFLEKRKRNCRTGDRLVDQEANNIIASVYAMYIEILQFVFRGLNLRKTKLIEIL